MRAIERSIEFAATWNTQAFESELLLCGIEVVASVGLVGSGRGFVERRVTSASTQFQRPAAAAYQLNHDCEDSGKASARKHRP